MRILNFGATFLVEALIRHGHSVISIGLTPDCTYPVTHPISRPWLDARLREQGVVPDACLVCDNGNLPLCVGIEALPFPSLFYSIDTYCNPWHVPYSYAFDQVLVAQREHVQLFPQLSAAPAWMPLFAPDLPPYELNSERVIPVAFVGTLHPANIPDRMPFLTAFRRLVPLVIKQGPYAPIFTRAQIVLNQTAASELNFRCFEAMACGAALLMEYSPHGLETLFTPGHDMLALYPRGDAAAAAAIVRDWLGRPEDLRQVAAAGYRRVREQHCATHRAAFVAACLADLVATGAHIARLAQLEQRCLLLSTAYAILADELAAPQLARHRELYARLFHSLVPA